MGVIMKTWCFIAILLTLLVIPVTQIFADNAGLVKAAVAGDIAAVLRYLERGASIESRDQNGKTALVAASQHGHTDLVKLLLDKGASINARTTSGTTAFQYAAQNHHIDTLKLLYTRGADVNAVDRLEYSPLRVAVTQGDEQVVRLLLDFGADPNMKLSRYPLLIDALRRNRIKIFQMLVENGADVNATREEYGDTPLMYVVASQQVDVIQLLLSRGADIRAKDFGGKNVLHNLLCNKYSKPENTQLLELLLNSNADYDAQGSSLTSFKDGSTPLICAVRRGFQESVNILLARRPDVNRKDQDGHTALYYAVEEENVAMVDMLLKHGANPALDSELEWEAHRSTEIAEMLLTALQPTLEARSEKCPKFKEKPARTDKRYQPFVTLDPLQSQNFPLAHVEVLKGIPPVGGEFSLSPNGKWLVVREDHRKTPQETSRRLLVYDIANQQVYFFSPKLDFDVEEDRWLLDSSRYVLQDNYQTLDTRQRIIDLSSGRPQLRTLPEPLHQSEALFAGGDRCPWRNNKGQVVLSRWDRHDSDLMWSADGQVVYSLQAGGSDEYYVIAQRGKEIKKLIRHSAKELRDQLWEQFELEFEKAGPADKRDEFEKGKAFFRKTPPPELIASHFALSPNDRFLYYRIGQAGGPRFFGLPDRNIVVDLTSIPLQVWFIGKEIWGTPQWHPNGRDLYFIDKNTMVYPNPDFPPMRQPSQWWLSVVRFP
jgi:ankyrin repeat protein